MSSTSMIFPRRRSVVSMHSHAPILGYRRPLLFIPKNSTILNISPAATLSGIFRGSTAGLPRVVRGADGHQKCTIVKISVSDPLPAKRSIGALYRKLWVTNLGVRNVFRVHVIYCFVSSPPSFLFWLSALLAAHAYRWWNPLAWYHPD